MAAVLRVGIVGVASKTSKPLARAVIPALMQSCGISGKVLRLTQNIVRPKPYPYKEQGYGITRALLDRTTKRFDDNTKVKSFC